MFTNIKAVRVQKVIMEGKPNVIGNILYNEMYQTPMKNKQSDNEIIKDYIYRIMMREQIKNKGKFGVGRTIIQFLQQEVDKLS